MPAEPLAVSSTGNHFSCLEPPTIRSSSIFATVVRLKSAPFVPMTGPRCSRPIGRTSTQSLQRRFFAPKKGFSEQELAFFLNIDFENHVALVAQIDEDGSPIIVGGGRYIVVRPGQAEIAFVVVDAYQGQGIGTILMRHLAVLARDAGLKELIAEVLPENTAMLKVFKKFGFHPGSKREPQVIHLTLQLA